MKVKSLTDIPMTVSMLADDVGRRCVDMVVRGTRLRDLEMAVSRCGRGAEYVRATPHYQVACLLASDGPWQA